MNFLDANGDGVITKKDLKALKKAGYLEGISASQAYKQLDANRDGVVDPYEAARLFGGQANALPYGYQPNPFQGYAGVGGVGVGVGGVGVGVGGMGPYGPPPPTFGVPTFQGLPPVQPMNPINGLNNFPPIQGGINGVNGVNGINGLGNYPGFGDFNGAYGGHPPGYGFGY